MKDTETKIKHMLLALYGIPGIGWHSLARAVEQKLWNYADWSSAQLSAIGLRKERAEKAAAAFAAEDWQNRARAHLATMNQDIAILTVYDENYPSILKEIAQPPWVLYARGRLELLDRPSASIVGTRVPTSYGRHVASTMARELAQAGITVVSGLAKGIDGIAHLAALQEKGGTVAVMPTPIDRCYPAEHHSLFGRIAREGLLLSETPPGTPLHRGQFHQRNRIIAALSQATIVVEGATQSGSLITAKYCIEMDRELFAVPGPLSSPKSEGPNELIRAGKARLMSSAMQLFEELPWLRDLVPEAGPDETLPDTGNTFDGADAGSAEELKLLRLLHEKPLGIDEIHETLGIPFGHLNSLLLNLCIKRKIELQSGSIYYVL